MKDSMSGQAEAGPSGTKASQFHAGEVEREGWTRWIGQRSPEGRFGTVLGLGLALVLVAAGCHKTPAQGASNAGEQYDPASANMAQPSQVLGQSAQNEAQQQAEDYQQQPAPIERRAPYTGNQNNQGYNDPNYNNNQSYSDGSMTDDQAADLYESDLTDEQADDPPPPLLVYDQPPAPDPDYLWTPGYWAWGPYGYYWVPGCWVAAPYVGALWTPGYWGFYGGRYRFHHGFWGTHIGFYGGINYGFGYFGYGYYGGYWDHDHFRYNTVVNRIDQRRVSYVYARPVPQNYTTVNVRVSFNGGRGGIEARPRPAEIAVLQERRVAPMQSQIQVQREAGQNRQQFFNQNRGRPAIVAAPRPVVADRTLPAPLPRVNPPVGRAGFRPAQTQEPTQGGNPQGRNVPGNGQFRQNQQNGGQPEGRQDRPQSQMRQAQPQQAEPQPQMRAEPQPQPQQIQPQWRQERPQSQRPVQPQQAAPQPDQSQRPFRQVQPQQATPQPDQSQRPFRQVQPQPQPQQVQPQGRQDRPQEMRQPPPESRMRQAQPEPQMRQAPPPQQAAPQPQPQMRQEMRQAPPQPRPEQARPQPPPQAQPQARPAPQEQARPERGEHKDDGRPRN